MNDMRENAWASVEARLIASPRDGFDKGWDAAIESAQEELVRRDQFTERTLQILDELRSAGLRSHHLDKFEA